MQRSLAVHDLVVRERQHELLAVGVHQRERDLVVVPLAVDRILLGVVEHVVHPAHVPLVGETEAAEMHRPRSRPATTSILPRSPATPGCAAPTTRIQLLQELDRLEVLAAAELVRHPLARLARVIEIQHRRDRVHPQTVDVELLDPVERVRSAGTTAPRAGRS